ncbi:hypothetical protein CS8_090770 [Cupriavidus sp. 8B]
MDRAQPQIAGGATAMPIAFDMIQKLADDGWRKVLNCHPIDCNAAELGRER